MIFESIILVATTFFFWFPSGFPVKIEASGIDTAEWRVFFALAGLVILTWLAWAVLRIETWSSLWQSALFLALIIAAVLLIVWAFPEEGAPLQVDRADWFWLLALLLPGIVLRQALAEKPFALTPVDLWMVLFLALGIINIKFSPYPSRGQGMLMRPLLGMALVIHIVATARIKNSISGVLRLTIVLTLFFGLVALLSTQWNAKSEALFGLIDRLPQVDRLFLPRTFNPNEIAGALAWLVPFAAAMIAYGWKRAASMWRLLAIIGFTVALIALLLGQSRFALIGVLLGLCLIAVIALDRQWRYVLLGFVVLLILIEAAILFNVIGAGGSSNNVGLSARDESTSMQRADIWGSALAIIGRYPFTGAGMNQFRYREAAQDFPIVGFDIPHPDEPAGVVRGRPPHAHNELLQLGADLGIGGLIFFVGMYGTLIYHVLRRWSTIDRNGRIVLTATLSALLAHALYGVGDAIPVWDRFGWLFWLMVGLTCGQLVLNSNKRSEDTAKLTLK